MTTLTAFGVFSVGVPAVLCLAMLVALAHRRPLILLGALAIVIAVFGLYFVLQGQSPQASDARPMLESAAVGTVADAAGPADQADSIQRRSNGELHWQHGDLESIWSLRETRTWPADGYPTRGRAIEALAFQIEKELQDGLAQAAKIVVLTDGNPSLGHDLVHALRQQGLRIEIAAPRPRWPALSSLMQPEVERFIERLTADFARAVASELGVKLHLGVEDIARNALRAGRAALNPHAVTVEAQDHRRSDEGMLTAWISYPTLSGEHASRTFTLRYVDSPWVVRDPGRADDESIVFVGRSGLRETSRAALAEAESRLRHGLSEAVGEDLRLHRLSALERRLSLDKPLRARLDRIRSSWKVQEQFVQRFETDSGPVFRAAVRTGGVNVPDVARQVLRMVSSTWQWALRSSLALLVMAVLTYLGYRILDVGTRGYFTWRWRFLSAAAFVVVAAMTLVFLA